MTEHRSYLQSCPVLALNLLPPQWLNKKGDIKRIKVMIKKKLSSNTLQMTQHSLLKNKEDSDKAMNIASCVTQISQPGINNIKTKWCSLNKADPKKKNITYNGLGRPNDLGSAYKTIQCKQSPRQLVSQIRKCEKSNWSAKRFCVFPVNLHYATSRPRHWGLSKMTEGQTLQDAEKHHNRNQASTFSF